METHYILFKYYFLNSLSVRHLKHSCDPDSALGPSICYPFYDSSYKLMTSSFIQQIFAVCETVLRVGDTKVIKKKMKSLSFWTLLYSISASHSGCVSVEEAAKALTVLLLLHFHEVIKWVICRAGPHIS